MFEKSNPEVGSRPGTLAIPPGSPKPHVVVVQYDADRVDRFEVDDPANLNGLLDSERVTWVDVQGLGDEGVLRAIGDAVGLHPVALEDAVNVPQRAKSEVYEDHQLVVARAPRFDEDGRLRVPQVCFVIGERYLVTFQERYFGFFEKVRERLAQGTGPMRREGPGYLAYALIDAMVDHYYPVAQHLSDRLEELGDLIVEHPHPQVLAQIHAVRRQLVVLRRVGWPQREVIGAILRQETPFVDERVHVYLRDTMGHISQIVELVDSSRELASDLAEAYLSTVSHHTNEIMKVLTLMASIFIPLTFLAGIYGMNFEHMPELHAPRGYFVVLTIMAVTAIGMIAYFRRRGWIGRTPPPDFGDGG